MIESSLAASTEPLVEAIIRRKLCEPAIFILEMCKPLVGCMRELYGIGEPLASALLYDHWYGVTLLHQPLTLRLRTLTVRGHGH